MTDHGGKHKGSGRKPKYNEPTKVVYVPESRVLEIKNYLKKPKVKIKLLICIKLILSLTCKSHWLQGTSRFSISNLRLYR